MNHAKNGDLPSDRKSLSPPLPPPQATSCLRVRTRVYHPLKHATRIIENVLVRPENAIPSPIRLVDKHDDDIDSDKDSLFSSSDSDSDDSKGNDDHPKSPGTGQQQLPQSQYAYWLQDTLREAIYGSVKRAVVLRRRTDEERSAHNDNTEWEVTGRYCAVKVMSWARIREGRKNGQSENPLDEVSIMQFLARGAMIDDPERFMVENSVLIPVDVWKDEYWFYCILPYANGGELFDYLQRHETFTEPEARYWMRQILMGLQYLKRKGVCHRDISLENLIIHNGRCIIMDFGMSLRIPYLDPKTGSTDMEPNAGKRLQFTAQGTCGKWNYMSPEIALDKCFDGPAVDLWAAGVILFTMLVGSNPWEQPFMTDDRFRYMTHGYLVQLLTQWNLQLSPQAMDLLQEMFRIDPRDRLSLEQVMHHPWVVTEELMPPDDLQPYQAYV